MKANEFVEKFGWDAAKHKADELKIIESMGDKLSFEDESLKRLVESHEYIESYGGLIESKRTLEMRHGVINLDGWDKLKQAIADVESCMEGV